MTITLERYDATNPKHVRAAEEIPKWQENDKGSPDHEQMFDLNPEKLGQHILGVICLDVSDNNPDEIIPVGYNGATYEFPDKVFETGGLIVNPEYRHRGFSRIIKLELLRQLAEDYPDHRLVTFANKNSEHINRLCGFRDAKAGEVPEGALTLCSEICTRYQAQVVEGGRICCDTLLTRDLKNIDKD